MLVVIVWALVSHIELDSLSFFSLLTILGVEVSLLLRCSAAAGTDRYGKTWFEGEGERVEVGRGRERNQTLAINQLRNLGKAMLSDPLLFPPSSPSLPSNLSFGPSTVSSFPHTPPLFALSHSL